MALIRKLAKLFHYAGLEKEEYNKLIPRIRDENRTMLRVFSMLGAVMFFMLFIVSILSGGFVSVNSPTYLVSGIVMLLILLYVNCFVPKHPELIMMLVYTFEIVLYVFGIHISMLHIEKPAVSAIAFLLVSPLLFYDRPTRLSSLIVVVVVIFSVTVSRVKQPDVAETDTWNMITFGILAIVTTVFIMNIKFRTLSQSMQIEYMSQTDLLTGLKNRNHYENQIQKYPEMCTSSLVCVYGDVNGLHEMNNKQGHSAGDEMLREAGAAIQRVFGPDHTYRIGGDEFAAFQVDGQLEKVSSEVERVRQELDQKGYHVSFGIAEQNKAQGPLNMDDLIKEAENNMYTAKREFYRQPEHNRRNR